VTTIKAETGDYDQSNSRLRLLGAITVDSAEGYVLRMTDAEVNFSNRTLVSENPVTIGYGESHISGKRLSVSDGGKLIVIDGDVRTTLLPPKNPPVANPPRPE
jgi:lipopolysaccharide export system protein LptC